MIQDYIMAACVGVFAISLVPQVVDNFRNKVCGVVLWTLIPTAVACWVFTGCAFSLGLWFTCILDAVSSILWTVLVVQRFAYKGRRKN